MPVLFESVNADGSISGLTEEYIRVIVKSGVQATNEILNVTIQDASADACIGLIAEPTESSTIRIAV